MTEDKTPEQQNSAPQFEEDPPRETVDADNSSHGMLLLNIDGYEGPIDVLLSMAKDQKVDLTKISILQLARQYLAFIDKAVEMQLELAAEYLVMASWLAYLKSRLLLPKQDDEEEIDAETMAEALQFQLRRLEAMQKAAEDLFALPQLGQDIFPRGMPEGLRTKTLTTYSITLYDLLNSYGVIQKRKEGENYELPTFHLMSMESAFERLGKMLGKLPRKGRYSVWTTLQSFLPDNIRDRLYARSSAASLFTASLEMAKQGAVEIKQDGLFRPIYLRGKEQDSDD
ncbi:MAG: ScpA family protein [Alphaproteobacteria bacterium]|jgi:segregation and condensation protein A|nr:ScpA family protein [Alphaproteobacteria bacterium]MDP7221791.1 ScpA family protein [Alphaproteobacteria bacterium]